MSLLDDVSIVVTPNGYKAGELYAVIPSDGAADMDVTRATAATRVDENGLVNYAEVIGSELVTCGDFECAVPLNSWTISGGNAEITSGLLNFTNATSFGTSVLNSSTVLAGISYEVRYTISNYISGSTRIRLGSEFGANRNANGDYVETVIASNTSILFYSTGSNTTLSIDNVSVKEVTRDNVPRIDYTGGGCPHILAEPQRTNLITYSEDFTDSSWSKSAAGTGVIPIVTSNYGVSPDGTQNADRIQFELNGGTSGADTSYISDFYTATGVSSTNSIYLKSLSTTKSIRLRCGGTFKSVDVTGDWQRFDVTDPSSSDRFQLLLYGNLNSQNADLLVWGGQAEEGSYATSYIPTSGSTVTRNQDIFTRDGIGSLINSTEGVLFVEMALLSDEDSNKYMSISDGTDDNKIQIDFDYSLSRLQYVVKKDAGVQANLKLPYTGTNMDKIAVKWKVNDFAVWLNGVEIGTDTSGLAPIGLNTLNFSSSGSNHFQGKVKQLQVYDTALTDTQLAALTS